MWTDDMTAKLAAKLVTFLNDKPKDVAQVETLFVDVALPQDDATELFTRFFGTSSLGEIQWLHRQVRQIVLLRKRGERRDAVQALLDEVMTPANRAYSWSALNGILKLDDAGKLNIEEQRFRTVAEAVAITLAELQSPACPITIHECALRGCDQLFLRTSSRGRPQQYCSDLHRLYKCRPPHCLPTHRRNQ